MPRKKNKGLDRRGRLMMLMWMSIWLGGSLWSGLHGGNGVLTAVWHGFLVMAGCMGVYLFGCSLCSLPEMWRHELERQERELREKEEYRRELLDEIERKYKNVNMDNEPLPPMDGGSKFLMSKKEFYDIFGLRL